MIKKYKILVTGGHLTPALATIDELRASLNTEEEVEFVWLGRRLTQQKTGQQSHEEKEMKKRGIRFIDIESGKSGEKPWQIIIKVSKAITKIKRILKEGRFDLVLSFGGYLGVPAGRAAQALKIPIVTHEQTRVLGQANRYLAKIAKVVALSYPEEKKTGLPKKKQWQKFILTGNPLRQDLFQENNSAPSWWPKKDDNAFSKKLPIFYVSGGSQGAQAINAALIKIIPELSQRFLIIHQVGAATKEHDFVKEYQMMAEKTGVKMENYLVRPYLESDELRFLYPKIDMAMARAGANTVAELTAFTIPTLYIPLPLANYDEQRLNAEYYVKQKMATMILQKDLTTETLLKEINFLAENYQSMKNNLRKLNIQTNQGTKNLVVIIKNVLEKKDGF